jgi:hypothetical protein
MLAGGRQRCLQAWLSSDDVHPAPHAPPSDLWAVDMLFVIGNQHDLSSAMVVQVSVLGCALESRALRVGQAGYREACMAWAAGRSAAPPPFWPSQPSGALLLPRMPRSACASSAMCRRR